MSKTLSKDSGMKIDYQFFRDTGQDPGLSWQTRTSGGPNHKGWRKKVGHCCHFAIPVSYGFPIKVRMCFDFDRGKKEKKKKIDSHLEQGFRIFFTIIFFMEIY